MVLCWREIRPDADKTTENEFVASFLWNDYPEKRIRENSCAAVQQACVFGSCECNKLSVLNIFMINGLNFQTV